MVVDNSGSGMLRSPNGLPYAEQHFHGGGEHPSPASRGSSYTSPPHHSRAGVSAEVLGLRQDDFFISHLQKSPTIHSGSLTSPRATSTPQSKWNPTYYRIPVIRNCGSNTLNFEFHDTTPRRVYNGISQPWKTTQQSSVNNWYPTWPAKEIRPLRTEAAAPPYLANSVNHATVSGLAQPGWSATWTKDGKRKKRWVKYDGIGPVDESGMPLASRSSVDSPKDWYRSMFQQIHSKLPESDLDCDPYKSRDHDHPGLMKNQPPGMISNSSSRQKNGLDWRSWETADATNNEPRSIFDYEPGKSSILDNTTLAKKSFTLSSARCPSPCLPIEEQLEKELQQLSEELDNDIRNLEQQQLIRKMRELQLPEFSSQHAVCCMFYWLSILRTGGPRFTTTIESNISVAKLDSC